MTKEEIYNEMDECLDCASISGFREQVENLLSNYSDEKVSMMLAEYLFNKYAALRAEGLATYMEVAIKRKPFIAMVNHPENPLFKGYFNRLPGFIFLIDQRTPTLSNPFKIRGFLFDSNSENQKYI